MIEATHLKKSFADVEAITDISFSAKNGEVTGLLGPNGAGKSTSLRIIYGLIRQDAGTALIDQIDVRNDRVLAQKKMGVLPDSHGLYTRLTAREHIQYFGQLHGLTAEQLDSQTEHLLRLLDMHSIADRRTEGFSTGERMKVCLARALVHNPTNVLLDEPTNGLDVMTTRAVRELISELRRQGIAVLFSSHLMYEVSRLCDHIVIVASGRVVATGTSDEIRAVAEEDNLEEAFVKLVEQATVLS